MDGEVDVATVHEAYTSRNHVKDHHSPSRQGPYTVLGVKTTKDGLLQHQPVLPVFSTIKAGVIKNLTTISRTPKTTIDITPAVDFQ
jgi:hypothetical protein